MPLRIRQIRFLRITDSRPSQVSTTTGGYNSIGTVSMIIANDQLKYYLVINARRINGHDN